MSTVSTPRPHISPTSNTKIGKNHHNKQDLPAMSAEMLEQIQKRIQELERRTEYAAAPRKAIMHSPHRPEMKSKDKKYARKKTNKAVKIEVKNEVKTEGKVKNESAKRPNHDQAQPVKTQINSDKTVLSKNTGRNPPKATANGKWKHAFEVSAKEVHDEARSKMSGVEEPRGERIGAKGNYLHREGGRESQMVVGKVQRAERKLKRSMMGLEVQMAMLEWDERA